MSLAMSLVFMLRPQQRATHARIKTSAFRGYVVELDPQDGGPTRMLENLRGKTVHFRSLERVREALRRRGVSHAELVQHHVCEELGALGPTKRREPGVAVLDETGS